MGFRKEIKDANRIVVKVGTSTLTYANGQINLGRIEKLTRVLADIVNSGKEVTLVSSGAVGVGVGKLKLKEKPTNIREKQALAAIGQCELMHIYSKFFGEYSHTVGQVLLTRDVIEDEHIKQNVCSTFELLLQKGIIPIVAIVSVLIDADLLIILSDIDGFYDSNPKENPNAKLIKQIDEITEEIEACAGGAGSSLGTGGMATKIAAARKATDAGVNMVLANGEEPSIISDILSGEEVGTLFTAKK